MRCKFRNVHTSIRRYTIVAEFTFLAANQYVCADSRHSRRQQIRTLQESPTTGAPKVSIII